ncbi:polymorphic toxin-type HINT domain-containing protein [Streptomyces bobili]|uniref:polymorphic toxin-type HINT domain-containing protein n=1 Tax=Streptomyces bobili TaxID=67280 RepID=UPI0036F79AB2
MADGTTKLIEDVRIGDEVLATDPETGRTVVRTVTAEITGECPKDLVTVTITVDDEKVRITAIDGHPFWVPALGRWVEAGELTAGQELHPQAGERVRITAADHTRQSATVHNLTIAALHTYYVRAGRYRSWCTIAAATSPGTPTRARARASATSPPRGSTRPRTLWAAPSAARCLERGRPGGPGQEADLLPPRGPAQAGLLRSHAATPSRSVVLRRRSASSSTK